jgi:hypothetical protein
VTANCENHAFETAEDACKNCGRLFCPDCIVYPWGPKRAPLCKACAIGIAGIRKHATRTPVASKREIKRMARARRREVRAAKNAPAEREPVITGVVDWDSMDDPGPAIPPGLPDPPASVPAAVGGYGMDDAELQEVRPSFDARLSRIER